MATEFANKDAVITDLGTRFEADNVGTAEEVLHSAPYGAYRDGAWHENTSCPFRLYSVYVSDQTGIDESSRYLQVTFVERKSDGKCWYNGQIPAHGASGGTFREDVLEYFKGFVPNNASVPIVVSSSEYVNGDKEESTALVVFFDVNDNAKGAKVYYDTGALTHALLADADVDKYVKWMRGL